MVPQDTEETLAQRPDIRGRDDAWRGANVVCGGFPCQDVSYHGRGAGITGARSDLWRWLCGAIRLVRPLYALVENVAALLDRGMGRVQGDLAEIGYDSEWHCIPASHVGLPHVRDRAWIVAYPRREREQGQPTPTLSDLYRIPWSEDERRAAQWLKRSDLHTPWLCGAGNGIRERLDALGNAVVPQIPEIIGRAILKAEGLT